MNIKTRNTVTISCHIRLSCLTLVLLMNAQKSNIYQNHTLFKLSFKQIFSRENSKKNMKYQLERNYHRNKLHNGFADFDNSLYNQLFLLCNLYIFCKQSLETYAMSTVLQLTEVSISSNVFENYILFKTSSQ